MEPTPIIVNLEWFRQKIEYLFKHSDHDELECRITSSIKSTTVSSYLYVDYCEDLRLVIDYATINKFVFNHG